MVFMLRKLPVVDAEDDILEAFEEWAVISIKRFLPFSILLNLRGDLLDVYLHFRGKNKDVAKLLRDSGLMNFYTFSEYSNDKFLSIPRKGFKIRRSKKVIRDVKTYIEKSLNKNLLQSVRESIVKELSVPDKIEYYSPVEVKFTPIVRFLNKIDANNVWIKLSFNPVSYDTSMEEDYLSVKQKLLSALLNKNIQRFLTTKIDLDIFPSGISNDYKFRKALLDVNSLLELFTDKPKIFCNFYFLSQNEEEAFQVARLFADIYFKNSSDIEIVDISANLRFRLENMFFLSEIGALIQLPFESEHLKLHKHLRNRIQEEQFKTYIYKCNNFVREKAEKDNTRNIKSVAIEEIFSQGGVFLHESSEKEELVKVIEQILLKNILNLVKESNKVAVFHFDSNYEVGFPNVIFLKTQNSYLRVDKSDRIKEKLEYIDDLIKDRINQKFGGKYKDIYEYNRESFVKEKIIFVLVELNELLNLEYDISNFERMITAGKRAGVYFVLYGNHEKTLPVKVLPRFLLVNNTKMILFPTDIYQPDIIRLEDIEIERLKSKLENLFNNISEEKDFLSIPIGVISSGEEVRFSLGEFSDAYHAFIVGATRSGKTTLINNILFEIARRYSAKEIRLILMDYKSGVEFNVFRYHPNVEKLYLNSDLKLSLKVLDELIEEMDKRAVLFRESKVAKISDYNRKNPERKIPYKILIIDEAQQLFQSEYARKFSDRLEQIARLGGAFGIHFILISQTFRNVRIRDTIKAQARLRIAFRLGDVQDIMEIFEAGNKAPLYLERFQCIYNTGFGVSDANILVNTKPPMFKDFKEAEKFLKEMFRQKGEDAIIPEVFEENDEDTASPAERKKTNEGTLEGALFNYVNKENLLGALEFLQEHRKDGGQ